VIGGETGGEWMSASRGDEPDSGIIAIVAIAGNAWTKTSAKDFEWTPDELLMAGK